jgi:hypothetical protein
MKNKKQKSNQNKQNLLVYGGLGAGIIVIMIVFILSISKPKSEVVLLGDEVPIQSTSHFVVDVPPDPYNSNPPAGGPHYDSDFPAKFYNESDLSTLPKYPEGYLVHNLEHGYVIFWYNCQVADTDCSALKQTIQEVMDETGKTKLIAFPWSQMDVPLAMTSWGRVLKFTQADSVLMTQFVERNRYQAPEPDAP